MAKSNPQVDALANAGAAALAQSVLTGGGPNKGVGPAIKAIREKFGATFPNGIVPYETARNVVRRVQRNIAAAAKITSRPDDAVVDLPRDSRLKNYPDRRYSYDVIVTFGTIGKDNKRTIKTTVFSIEPLKEAEIKRRAKLQIYEMIRGYIVQEKRDPGDYDINFAKARIISTGKRSEDDDDE